MKKKQFQKRKEDFTCGNCRLSVKGNGYTNHCPRCLWSLHVDVNPGDRSEVCRGMMRPIGVEIEKGGFSGAQKPREYSDGQARIHRGHGRLLLCDIITLQIW